MDDRRWCPAHVLGVGLTTSHSEKKTENVRNVTKASSFDEFFGTI